MQTVFLIFLPAIPQARQEEVLIDIRSVKDVQASGWLSPDASEPNTRRAAYVSLDDGADAAIWIERLKVMPEIESAFIPSVRGAL